MKKIHRIIMSLFLSFVVCATSVCAAPSTKELKDKKSAAESEVKTLKEELTEIMTEMHLIEQQLIASGEKIISVNEQLKEVKQSEKRQYESMMKRIAVTYENGSANTLAMILDAGSIGDALQRIETAIELHKYDRKQLDSFVETREEVEALKATLEQEQESLQSLQTELLVKENTLNSKIEAKKTEVANLDNEIRAAATLAAQNSTNNSNSSSGSGNVSVGTNPGGGRPYTGTGDPSVGQAIVARARSYIGVWYLWGGNDRNGIDCSGLTKAVHAEVGITIDRWSGHQEIGGKGINSLEEAMPGDIICYPGHVAIYIGNYRVIHAPRSGKQVQEATVYLKEITAIRRYW